MMPEYSAFDFDQVDFITSDTHFSHARIIQLADRPFTTVDEMDAELVRRWNQTAGADDIVLHPGDLALGPIAYSPALTAQLHGRRLLVAGNHDRVLPATQTSRAIERFMPLCGSWHREASHLITSALLGASQNQQENPGNRRAVCADEREQGQDGGRGAG